MRVKCFDIPTTGPSGGYLIGLEHRVLEIAIDPLRTLFRVEVPVGSPYLVEAKYYMITSGLLPTRWIVEAYANPGAFKLTPTSWACDGFWEAYFDGESWAEELYEQEVALMRSEDPLPNE